MRGRMGMALASCLLVSLWSVRALSATPEAVEKRRIARVVSHLKRLERPRDWLLVRRLFSPDLSEQSDALSHCSIGEREWPWYLSSDHLRNYAFSVDFIPLDMDEDDRLETLMVIQSDYEKGKANYVTFCLMDDDGRRRAPLASYSDMSHGREITYQIADLTADGAYELMVNVRGGLIGQRSDAVRIVKLTEKRRFALVWFARLEEEWKWPIAYVGHKEDRAVQRSENLRARARFRFNGPGNPVTLILKGVRRYEERFFDPGGARKNSISVARFAFEKFWRWSKTKSQFVRVFDAG